MCDHIAQSEQNSLKLLFRKMFCITLLSSIVAEMVTRGTVINSKGCLVSIIQGVQLIVSETKAILCTILGSLRLGKIWISSLDALILSHLWYTVHQLSQTCN